MKVLIAPNAFKGTIKAERAAELIKSSILEKHPDLKIQLCPIADGGDGTCSLLAKSLDYKEIKTLSLDAAGKPKYGSIFLNKSQGCTMVDISSVSGIQGLKPYEIDAQLTSSFGTGKLVVQAIEQGAQHIILGLGGSATVDMGTGILRALGYLFIDQNGREITVFSPGFLDKIAHIQLPVKKWNLRFTCLCDVNNTFFGDNGAIPVFGPQKGLQIESHQAFGKSAKRVFELMQRRSKVDLQDQPGFGAAGGIALGLSAFFPVEIKAGSHYFFEQVGIREMLKEVDWMITGEGKFDQQSASGKGSYELLQLAKKMHKKTIMITSGNGEDAESAGFDEVILLPDLDLGKVHFHEQAEENLKLAVGEFIARVKIN